MTQGTGAGGAPPRPGVLEEQRWPEVRDAAWPVALLPFGATEPHNTHLPYGTDTLLAREVAARVAAACVARWTWSPPAARASTWSCRARRPTDTRSGSA